MNKALLTIFQLFIFSRLFSQVISYSEAKTKAEIFFRFSDSPESVLKSGEITEADTFCTFYTGDSGLLKSGSLHRDPAFYIFNRSGRDGFVIVSAEERVKDFIAWSVSSKFCEINPGMKVLLDQYVREITLVRELDISTDAGQTSATVIKGPLLRGIEWSQSPDPFNTLCPVDPPTGRKCPAGCVATAMAQVIYHYKFPAEGIGNHGYRSAYGYEYADYARAVYKYAEMADKPALGIKNHEIAELNYHCAVALETDFGPYGSAAYVGQISSGLERFFKYKKPTLENRYKYTDEAWKALIINEIEKNRPVIYSALDPLDPEDTLDVAGGHAFVVDGYDDQELFHINWGWDGCSNGYYSLNLINPASCGNIFNYSVSHSMIIGIEPNSAFVCNLSASDDFLQYVAAGGTRKITLTSNSGWTVTGNDPWIAITPAAGLGNGNISIEVSPNEDFFGRSGTVTVRGCDISKTIKIVQDGTCMLSVSSGNLDFSVSADTAAITLVADAPWVVTENSSWIEVSPAMGTGNVTLSVSVPRNPGYGQRTDTVVISGCNVTRSVVVVQEGPCSLEVSSRAHEFSPAGGTELFPVISNSSWTALSNASWISVSPASHHGSTTLAISATANPDPSIRIGTVSLLGCNITRTINIIQQSDCIIASSLSRLEFPHTAGNRSVDISSNSTWTATSNALWLSVTPPSGDRSAVLKVAVTSNPTSAPRSGSIRISGCGKVHTISVEQKSTCLLDVSTELLDFSYMPGSKSASVTTDTYWNVSSDASWIAITPKYGIRSGSFMVTVPMNTGDSLRSGTITISGCNYSRTIAVVQDACRYTLSDENLSFSPEPGTKHLIISSNSMWTTTVTDPWITLSSTIGNHNETILVTVAANTGDKRSAWLTVSGCFSAKKVEVSQEAVTTALPFTVTGHIMIYPSPTDRYVRIELPVVSRRIFLEVFSETGQKMLSKQIGAPGDIIDLNGLRSGIYLFRIFNDDFAKIEKIVLK